MKRISVFGAKGLLGDALVRQYRAAGYDVRAYTRADVDLADAEALARFLERDQAELILNASGMTGLEACLDFADEAERVNVLAPAMMARSCAAKQIPFVHFSTDYVFDGAENKFLTESDTPNPVSVYGRTKLDGELQVLANNPEALICRVSWLFGAARKSFVDQVVSNAQLGKPQAYISDKWSVPNSAEDLAKMCADLVQKKAQGVIHLCSSGGEVTWYTYAATILEIMGELGMLESGDGLITESKLEDVTAFRAIRPRFTSMCSSRLTQEYAVNQTDWKVGLRRYLASCQ